ncbi:hypothetical protein BD779DRAFT_1441849 [Infundibulicybe gibba]|nr:hypothetical protein BD779DRAFT_1441849 [Infundibulicybe gibba]
MHRQRIRSVPSWRGGPPRRDCIFLSSDPSKPGMRGLHVAQVILFLSFSFHGVLYPCALVRWFVPLGNEPCPDAGMWIFQPELDEDGDRVTTIVHLESVVRSAHLIGLYGDQFLPKNFSHTDSLQTFHAYYVSKYSDHHAHELAF